MKFNRRAGRESSEGLSVLEKQDIVDVLKELNIRDGKVGWMTSITGNRR